MSNLKMPGDEFGWAIVQCLSSASLKLREQGRDNRAFDDLASAMTAYLQIAPHMRTDDDLQEAYWHFRRARKLIDEIT